MRCPADGRDGQFGGYAVDKTDAPAVDIQQEDGSYQRLTLAVVFFVGALGAVVLLGFLSLAVILAQVVALVLLGFAPGGAGDRDLPRRRPRLLSQLAGQARHRGLHQGAVLAGDRDRRRGLRRASGLDRVARVPVLLRAADGLLLGDLPVSQADHRPAGRRHHRRRLRRTDATDDRGPARRRRRHSPVRGARRDARPRRTRRHRPPGERARRRLHCTATSNGAPAAHGLDHHDRDTRPDPVAATDGSHHGVRSSRIPGASPAARPSGEANGNGSAPSHPGADGPALRVRARDAAPEHELSPRASHEDAMRRARELRERQRTTADDEADRS